MERLPRILGCLLGGACGDALGAPVEFQSATEIGARFGSEGIRDFVPAYGVLGAVTDDTQMTLFTVDGLIRSAVRRVEHSVDVPGVVHHSYLRWLATQDHSYSRLWDDHTLDGWLIRDKRLWASRAPGRTCLSALRTNTTFGRPAHNTSKGCGTVMRDAPFGFFGTADEAFGLANRSAQTTHGHPSAGYSSAALAAMISSVAEGMDLRRAAQTALSLLDIQADGGEVARAIREAIKLSDASDWKDKLTELGEGWVAEEALAIALLCALAADGPREAIVTAVNHGGDSDSTGSITGNLVGALYGPEALPEEWTSKVELRDVIETLAEDLAAATGPQFPADQYWERYPGW